MEDDENMTQQQREMKSYASSGAELVDIVGNMLEHISGLAIKESADAI